jgi:hypothetical protein
VYCRILFSAAFCLAQHSVQRRRLRVSAARLRACFAPLFQKTAAFRLIESPSDQNIIPPQLKSCFDHKIKVIFDEVWHLNIDKIL